MNSDLIRCPECNGEGKFEVMEEDETISFLKCRRCDGEGEICIYFDDDDDIASWVIE